MALNQIIQHNTGAYSSYWRVVATELDYQSEIANITLLGYVDEGSRLSEKQPLDRRAFLITDDNFNAYFAVTELDKETNPVKQAYLYIKTTQEFIGSVDV